MAAIDIFFTQNSFTFMFLSVKVTWVLYASKSTNKIDLRMRLNSKWSTSTGFIFELINDYTGSYASPRWEIAKRSCIKTVTQWYFCSQVTKLQGHIARVGALAWNGDILSSGSRDRHIRQRDTRTPREYHYFTIYSSKIACTSRCPQ